jgi:hypothetical protein
MDKKEELRLQERVEISGTMLQIRFVGQAELETIYVYDGYDQMDVSGMGRDRITRIVYHDGAWELIFFEHVARVRESRFTQIVTRRTLEQRYGTRPTRPGERPATSSSASGEEFSALPSPPEK